MSLPFADSISGFTGSKQAIAKARSWLQMCTTEHACSKNISSRLPTRVLRIEGPKLISLHISQGEIGSYACLSHCWGDQSLLLLKTTANNLEKFQDRIPWEDLPKTLRNAIYFTYNLGLKYLWIDSLCILQDSVDDWRHEGSAMADIYESALITLVATMAPNATHGCFAASRSKHKSRYMKVTANTSLMGMPFTVHVRDPLPHGDRNKAYSLPLLSRGW